MKSVNGAPFGDMNEAISPAFLGRSVRLGNFISLYEAAFLGVQIELMVLVFHSEGNVVDELRAELEIKTHYR
jgi:hypothetical protein